MSVVLMNAAVWAAAVWESTEALATAFGSPEFQRMAAEFPDDIGESPERPSPPGQPRIRTMPGRQDRRPTHHA